MKRYGILRFATYLLAPLLALFTTGCGNGTAMPEPGDRPDSGTIHISVDESFKPVIDSEISVFEALHPGTHIIAHYKPEAECLRDLAVDSIRCIVATRRYSEAERNFVNDSLKTDLRYNVVAYDAVAVIVHPSSADTVFTIAQLKDLLSGRSTAKLRPVFDGLKATSTVRFVIDSMLRGGKLGANVTAAEGSEAVIDYVAKNPDAIGLLGVSWVGNSQDSTQLSYLSRVKVASLEDARSSGKFVTPAQYNIYFKRYPLLRDLVCILKERHNGLGHGFYNYLTTQSGQLIFNRAFLMPALMNFQVRQAEVSD
ncbi:PstS family phosphate ABC transporter substrate-binding protein [Flaviaesturariibacter aridisoli]|uniref:Phosphate ABC transporter substrate-binding protein, PhoT family n=1 Tax=Flaviaesturariibacter aridisoli TaxID=2545761 RepID=A0A4R4E7J4_9BACT|nr:substrate-binding domain-containing protein [Flaviaesturariibacter aridisoli]TCZ73695.1 phosphate ABC transporter substrate-binding protein, PhoT family [Flaviaesturariibacter aridisoli]